MTEMMTDQEFKKLMAKARETNAWRDKADREAGFTAPGDSGLDIWARTVIMAIEAGIKTGDNDALAEGLVMLTDLELAMRERVVADGAARFEPWNRR